MVRLLVSNGCSFTRGEELTEPEGESWPSLLARLFRVELVNLAQIGASNRRIVRSTVLALDDIRRRSGFEPEEILVLLAWTQSSRHEYYSPSDVAEQRIDSPGGEIDLNWHQIGSWRYKNRHRPSRAFYRELWSEEGQLINFFLDWILLDRWLSTGGYEARYVFAIPPPAATTGPASLLMGQLDPQLVWGGLPVVAGRSFREISIDLPRGPGGHPLADGHARFASLLADWLLC